MAPDKKSNLLSHVTLEMFLYAAIVLLAAALRLWGLGLRLLSAGEAEHALAAWQLYQGLDYTPQQPLYLLTTLCSFGLGGVSDATARLAPALAGIALVALPALLRRQLGRVGALVAAALLALSPSFVFFSDSAEGATLALAASLLLVAGLWRYLDAGRPNDIYLAATGLGLSLTAGPAAYPVLLTVAAFVGVLLAARRWPRPDRSVLIQAGLLCGGMLIVAATVALTRPDGLHEALVNEPGRWLAGFVAPRAIPWEHALRLLVLYDPAAFVLGVMAVGYLLAFTLTPAARTRQGVSLPGSGSTGEGTPLSLPGSGSTGEGTPLSLPGRGGGGEGGSFAPFLVLWALLAFLLATLAGAISPAAQSLPVVLPLILLAGLFIDRLLDRGFAWAETRRLMAVFALALAYVVVALVRLVIWQDQTGSEFTIAASLVIIIVTVLYWTWAARPRWLGLAGILIGLLILSVHGAVYLIYPPATGPRDLLTARPTSADVRLLLADLEEVEFLYHKTDWAGPDIAVHGEPDPLWGWLLRGQRVTFTGRPGETRPRVIIAPLEWQPPLDETLTGYERKQYTVSIRWAGGPFTWDGFIEWFLYRHSDTPPEKYEFSVYIRQ